MQYRLIDYDNANLTVISPYSNLFPVAGVIKVDGEGWKVTYQQTNLHVPEVLATNLKTKGEGIVAAIEHMSK